MSEAEFAPFSVATPAAENAGRQRPDDEAEEDLPLLVEPTRGEPSAEPNPLRPLLAVAHAGRHGAEPMAARLRRPLLSRTGFAVIASWVRLDDFPALVGVTLLSMPAAATGQLQARAADVMELIKAWGIDALPIITIANGLVRAILGFVGAVQLRRFGAPCRPWSISCSTQWAGWLVQRAAWAALLLGSVKIASAQTIGPNEFVPFPDRTTINMVYFNGGRQGAFYNTAGNSVPNSSANLYEGFERLVHFDYVFGHPAGFQIIQGFGSLSDTRIGGTTLPTASGAANVNLSLFFWPYADFENKQYLILATFLYPPVGSYNKNQPINFATAYQYNGQYNWTGDLQIGWEQGIGDHFSYDAAFDARFFGNTTGPISPGSAIPLSVTTHHNPDFRLQLWLNWAWNRALTTAVGYEGWFAGDDWFNNPIGAGHVNTGKSYEQRLRGAVATFLSPRFQTQLEVNGDVARAGGYKQTIGTRLRFLYIF